MLDEVFERPVGFDLARFWSEWQAEFEASRPRLAVTVRAHPSVFAVLPEVLGDSVRPALDAASDADDDGWRTLVLTFESEVAAAHRLLGFGGGVEVIEPVAVRERIVVDAESALRRYRGVS